MPADTAILDATGIREFQGLRPAAIESVTARFYEHHRADYSPFGDKGREACREDLAFHLDFLRPVLEFGLVQPMVDYLRWLSTVLRARDVPTEHLPRSLEWLAEFFAARMEPTRARVVTAAVRRVLQNFAQAPTADSTVPGPLPEWPECHAFETALLAGDRKRAESVLQHTLDAGHDLVDAEMHLVQPALYSIGRKWQDNQVSVAQEHVATAIAQMVMARGLLRARPQPPNGRKVLLACVEGNHHAVGLQMVADAFQLAGWEVEYLGANMPTAALVRQVADRRPDLVGLSLAFPQHLRVVRQVMSSLAEAMDTNRPPVIIGGLAINQFSALASELGASGWSADARAAVGLAARLAPGARTA